MPEAPKLHETPDLPMDDDGPVFDEPWQAQAFALVIKLFEAGHFTWNEWVDYLSAEIAAGEDSDSADHSTVYFQQWLGALEKIIAAKGLSSAEELASRKSDWKAADRQRAFGKPLELASGASPDSH